MREEWQKQADFLTQHMEHVDNWERGLLYSVKERLAIGIELSFHQSKYLRRAYNRVVGRIG